MAGQANEAREAHLSVRVLRRLSKTFSIEAAFDAPSGFTMLVGPSGGGKTTLLNCVAGLVRPDAGRIALGSRVLFDSASNVNLSAAERHLGYLFQNLALFPHLTIEQNVQYGITKVPRDERRTRMMALLESFHIADLLARKPNEISGGQRQRAALARSLVTNPSLLLLDEPLVALDMSAKARILDDLRSWNASHGIPILYVTHSPEEAFALGERVVVIESGRIVAQGTPQNVLTKPRHETIAQWVGFENVFDATVRSLSDSQGTMLCQLDGSSVELEVPLVRTETGARVRIAIRAGDIMVATERPHGLSARNAFQGKLVSLRNEGVTVTLTIESGATFEVHVTPSARDELGLVAGRRVWLVIKTYSCNLIEPDR
ncbi:MAG TPA: molybdenum ABC transporter ATP-binding protein [Candidatus Binataceae bacterium]